MKFPRLKPAEALMFGLFAIYTFAFFDSISFGLFNSLYTTDDARQQTYPLYRAIYPGAFENDPITESMMGYLSPVHWWISYAVTLITRSPIMTGHVVFFIQLLGTLIFLYKLVEHLGGRIPGLFAVTWYLHTRGLPARMTGGLPRGWAGLILVAFLYYLVRRRHNAILLLLLFGILTNPPAAFMSAFCYGLFLCLDIFRNGRSAESFRPALRYFVLCPIFALVAVLSLKRPPEFGHMATIQEARSNPAFSRYGGRFPFLPLKPAFEEVRNVGMAAFFPNKRLTKYYFADILTGVMLSLVVLVSLYDFKKKRELIPSELKIYFGSIFIIYFLSRVLAFRLYVPDRHLQFPLNTFWIVALTILVWRVAQRESNRWGLFTPTAALFGVAGGLYLICGTALGGSANFNTRTYQLDGLYTFIRTQTPMNSVIAGNPRDIDGVQLYAMRPGYITDETAHPFYSGYWKLCTDRLKVAFRAYYAPNLQAFLNEIGNEQIDYFFVNRARFTPQAISRVNYTKPFESGVKRLAAKAAKDNIIDDLADPAVRPAIAYDDGEGILIDVRKLRSILKPVPAGGAPQSGGDRALSAPTSS